MSRVRKINGEYRCWIPGCEDAECIRYTRKAVEQDCKVCMVCGMKPRRAAVRVLP